MSDRNSKLPELLAARVRLIRQPSPSSRVASPRAESLRLAYDDGGHGIDAHAIHNADAMAEASRGAQALRVADNALAKIEDRLNRLAAHCTSAASLPPSMSTSGSSQPDALPPDRSDVSGPRELLMEVDQISSGAELAGRALFSGSWSVSIVPFGGGPPVRLALPRIHSTILGGVSGRASEVEQLVLGQGAARAAVIVSHAIRQVREVRSHIASFVHRAISPLIEALDVARENVAAAMTSIDDRDWPAVAAGVSAAGVLATSPPVAMRQATSGVRS